MTDSESKRTEYLWDQMSVMERCEVLRSEVKELRLKQIASRIKTYPMSDGERLDDLARRVAEIEGTSRLPKGWTRDMVEEFNRWKPSEEVREALSGLGPDMIEVPASELARLRRIEEQLKALRKALMWNGSVSAAAWITDIDATLDSEPKR